MYSPSKLRRSMMVSSLSEIESELVRLKNELKPNDEVEIVLKGPRILEMITVLPELLRRHDYGLIWAEENINDMTITAYARYKTISPSQVRLREGLRKRRHKHMH